MMRRLLATATVLFTGLALTDSGPWWSHAAQVVVAVLCAFIWGASWATDDTPA